MAAVGAEFPFMAIIAVFLPPLFMYPVLAVSVWLGIVLLYKSFMLYREVEGGG